MSEIAPHTLTPVNGSKAAFCPAGGDSDDATNPFEVRLGKFVDLDVDDDVIGIMELRRINEEGPKRHQLGLVLEGEMPSANHSRWYDIQVGGIKVGDMTNGTWSRKLGQNIGFALISRAYRPGDHVEVLKERRMFGGILSELPFS